MKVRSLLLEEFDVLHVDYALTNTPCDVAPDMYSQRKVSME